MAATLVNLVQLELIDLFDRLLALYHNSGRFRRFFIEFIVLVDWLWLHLTLYVNFIFVGQKLLLIQHVNPTIKPTLAQPAPAPAARAYHPTTT